MVPATICGSLLPEECSGHDLLLRSCSLLQHRGRARRLACCEDLVDAAAEPRGRQVCDGAQDQVVQNALLALAKVCVFNDCSNMCRLDVKEPAKGRGKRSVLVAGS